MDAIYETALLGTAKKALDLQLLPKAVLETLGAWPEDPEHEFLAINAYLNFYNLAGRLPKKYTGQWNDQVIDEQKAVAPAELLLLLNSFDLIDYQLRESLLASWLDVLVEQQYIVSAELVIALIERGKNLSNQTKTKIIKVVGNKGAWILQYDPSLNYAAPTTGTIQWQDGTTQERKLLFTALRKTNAETSIALLRSTWSTEPIVAKRMFLEIIQQTPIASDLPFLEDLYTAEFQYRAKEKKTEKECRRILACLLLAYPSSTLYQQTAASLTTYFARAKKGILDLVTQRDTTAFNLPDHEDSFWSVATMEQQYGLDARVYDIAMFTTLQQFWLSHFLEYMPITFWASFFNGDYNRTAQYWLTERQYQTKISGNTTSIYAASLISNIQHYQDKAGAQALSAILTPTSMLPILPIMDTADFETYIAKHQYFTDVEQLANGPFTHELSWSLDFSAKIISAAYELSLQNKTSTAFGKIIAQYAHHDSLSTLYEYTEKAKEKGAHYNWDITIFQLAQPTLDLRKKIYAYKTKTP